MMIESYATEATTFLIGICAGIVIEQNSGGRTRPQKSVSPLSTKSYSRWKTVRSPL